MELTTTHPDGTATVETVPDVTTQHDGITIRWFVGLQVMSSFSGADICTQPSSILDLDPSEWTVTGQGEWTEHGIKFAEALHSEGLKAQI